MAAATWATVADLRAWIDLPVSGGDDTTLQRCLDVAQEQQSCRLDPDSVQGWLDDTATVPEAVKQALLMRASALYRRRQTPEGVSGIGDLAVVRVGGRDPDVERMESPYIHYGVT